MKYVYYYLKTINFTILKSGCAHPKLNSNVLKSIKIPLPDLATQQQIVDYCDDNQNLIEQLEQNIKINEELY
jgi:Type I restriction modification DNA specificity domain.